jgi:hypothetical protein
MVYDRPLVIELANHPTNQIRTLMIIAEEVRSKIPEAFQLLNKGAIEDWRIVNLDSNL